MAKDQGMQPNRSFLRMAFRSGLGQDLALLPGLGLAAYFLFGNSSRLQPVESALLLVGAGGLLLLAKVGWRLHQRMTSSGILQDRIHRILAGDRTRGGLIEGVSHAERLATKALDAVLEENSLDRESLADLREALAREWRELDAMLVAVEQSRASGETARLQVTNQLQSMSVELKKALEQAFDLSQLEMTHRLRSDQYRLQGQAFRGALDQILTGLERLDNHLEELHDVFPRLRREEEALGRLADAGLRHGAVLTLKVKGLVAQTPRLVGEGHGRAEALRRFRLAADVAKDQVEGLARRIGTFREEAQGRIQSFGAAQGSLRELDSVAQQAGLLAVNAAILAQQGGSGASLAAIGGRLRALSDQTSEGTSGLERVLDQHQQGLEHEYSGLWTLQEVTLGVLETLRDLLRQVGEMDRQAQELERGLDAQLGLVDQVHQASERAELSLCEIQERATGLESAHGRQWGVEAKLVPERERLTREAGQLLELGEDLSRINLQNIDAIWGVVARSQELKQSGAYQQAMSGDLLRPLSPSAEEDRAWSRLSWARIQRSPRLLEAQRQLAPTGWRDELGWLHLQLMRLDTLQQPVPSAVASWSSDRTGMTWALHLDAVLSQEDHRSTLIECLKDSPLKACFPTLECRITATGAEVKLPSPFPGFPAFLAGLGLDLILPDSDIPLSTRGPDPCPPTVQQLVWAGPQGQQAGVHAALELVHGWVRNDPAHEGFLDTLRHPGQRPPCPLRESHELSVGMPLSVPVRCLGLGADVSILHPLRDRLLRAGAIEGAGGLVLCAIGLGHVHPTSLLLRLFQRDENMAGESHPELVPFQVRLREEVLAASTGDPYRAAWSLLEDLQREGWVLPLPSGA